MSVINKMLRDLDQRQAAGAAVPPDPAPAGPDLRRGTASLGAPLEPRPRGFRAPRPGAARLRNGLWGLAVIAAALGWWWRDSPPAHPPAQAVAETKPSAAPAPASASASAPQAVAAAPMVVPSPPLLATQRLAVPDSVPVVRPGAAPSAQNAPVGAVALRMDSQLRLRQPARPEPTPPGEASKSAALAERPSAPLAPPAAVLPALPDAAQLAQRQQQASKEAMAQALSLWNTGSRDAAIDMLEEVVASAERSVAGGANAALLVLPVRELTRMQLAQSRPQAVWTLLHRLEPLLGNQADLWAVRAHAAQRLGHHQDSVHAYLAALQSRPNESRWLLGAAVSLAALGQTAGAADMAEKARANGVVSKEVLAYLRQMGVSLKGQ